MACNSTTREISDLKTYHMTDGKLKQLLFDNVVKMPDWEKVVKIYEEDVRAHKMKITSSGHTALHLAISSSKKKIVQKLVELIITKDNDNNNNNKDNHRINYDVSESAEEALRIKNEKGHTPLHMAAATGSRKMCKFIIEGAADAGKLLVLERDNKGETPLFRAVHCGRKKAFLYLQSVVCGCSSISYCWRNDDQTILHNAIFRENFDLAYQIIHLYKDLVNYVDKEDVSPLHVLAKKPAAFKSGSNLRGRDKIVYNCTFVKVLKLEPSEISDSNEGVKNNKNPDPPKSSLTFLEHIGLLLRNLTRAGNAKNECANADIEKHGHVDQSESNMAQEHQYFLPATLVGYFVKFVRSAIPYILGYGYMSIKKIRKEKEKHVRAVQVLNELLEHATMYDGKVNLRASQQPIKTEIKVSEVDSSDDDTREDHSDDDDSGDDNISESSKNSEQPCKITNVSETGKEEPGLEKKIKKDTAILLAAKFGIAEMVEKILDRFSVAIYDKDKDSKNVVLVTVENRHLQVYKLLISRYEKKHVVFQKVDKKGNTALHFSAMYDQDHTKPWPVPGSALQMQWEIKWHEFVENTMPPRLFLRTNMEGKTPRELFSNTHKGLVKAGGEWLTSTATSCSVVATLIATVAFASSTTVPGGSSTTDTKTGKTLHKRASPITFELFAILSLIALCFSVTSLIMFLAILTSRHQEKDFGKELPRKILFGLTSLFVSIASMLVTFCAGHFLVFEDNIKYAALPVYAVTLLPLCLFAAAQFPLYFDLLLATFWSPF